jgi:hypothetical protein
MVRQLHSGKKGLPTFRGDQSGRLLMFVHSKLRVVAWLLSFAAAGFAPSGASAITVEVAKKCNGLLAKAFPPRVAGNPAAGSAKGSSQDERDYFKKCVANGGNMDGSADKNAK